MILIRVRKKRRNSKMPRLTSGYKRWKENAAGKIGRYGDKQAVWAGLAYSTKGGLTRSDLMVNKRGKVVSKRAHRSAKLRYAGGCTVPLYTDSKGFTIKADTAARCDSAHGKWYKKTVGTAKGLKRPFTKNTRSKALRAGRTPKEYKKFLKDNAAERASKRQACQIVGKGSRKTRYVPAHVPQRIASECVGKGIFYGVDGHPYVAAQGNEREYKTGKKGEKPVYIVQAPIRWYRVRPNQNVDARAKRDELSDETKAALKAAQGILKKETERKENPYKRGVRKSQSGTDYIRSTRTHRAQGFALFVKQHKGQKLGKDSLKKLSEMWNAQTLGGKRGGRTQYSPKQQSARARSGRKSRAKKTGKTARGTRVARTRRAAAQFPKTVGTRREVWDGIAYKTGGGLRKSDLKLGGRAAKGVPADGPSTIGGYRIVKPRLDEKTGKPIKKKPKPSKEAIGAFKKERARRAAQREQRKRDAALKAKRKRAAAKRAATKRAERPRTPTKKRPTKKRLAAAKKVINDAIGKTIDADSIGALGTGRRKSGRQRKRVQRYGS